MVVESRLVPRPLGGFLPAATLEVVNAAELLKERFVVTGQTFVNNGSLLRAVNAE